jgi:3-oxoacyl-[acyl-carrier-protein] synthase III
MQVAADLGADVSVYRGWGSFCEGGADEHPSTMSAAALRLALEQASLSARDLKLVVSAGMSRDYLPSWSVSTEVMNLVGCGPHALGLDVTVGCLGTMAALNLALGWLATAGGGYAAITAAERWAYTVDRSSNDSISLWGHSDGGGALVVGVGAGQAVIASYLGSEYVTMSELNGRVLIRYGGTRFPAAPAGVNFRTVSGSHSAQVRRIYLEAYGKVFDRVRERFSVDASWLVCNQLSPGFVRSLPELGGVDADHVVVTGHRYGHLGPADIIAGIDQLLTAAAVDGPVLLGASTPYAFGAGLLIPGPV